VTEPQDTSEPEKWLDIEISLDSTRELERSLEPDGATCHETLFELDSEIPADCIRKLEIGYSRESVARSEDPKPVESMNSRDSRTEIDDKNKSETEFCGEWMNKYE
jgi:hypothetical protein